MECELIISNLVNPRGFFYTFRSREAGLLGRMQLRRGEACLPSDIKKLHVETVLWSLIKLRDSFGSRELARPPAGHGGVGAVPDGDVFGRVSSSPSALTSVSSSLCSHGLLKAEPQKCLIWTPSSVTGASCGSR